MMEKQLNDLLDTLIETNKAIRTIFETLIQHQEALTGLEFKFRELELEVNQIKRGIK